MATTTDTFSTRMDLDAPTIASPAENPFLIAFDPEMRKNTTVLPRFSAPDSDIRVSDDGQDVIFQTTDGKRFYNRHQFEEGIMRGTTATVVTRKRTIPLKGASPYATKDVVFFEYRAPDSNKVTTLVMDLDNTIDVLIAMYGPRRNQPKDRWAFLQTQLLKARTDYPLLGNPISPNGPHERGDIVRKDPFVLAAHQHVWSRIKQMKQDGRA